MKKVVVIKGQMLHDAGRIGDPVTVGNLWGDFARPDARVRKDARQDCLHPQGERLRRVARTAGAG